MWDPVLWSRNQLLGLLTQLQQDTKGIIMDIFLVTGQKIGGA